jgi:hypothetical protein
MKMVYNGCFLTDSGKVNLAAWWAFATMGRTLPQDAKTHMHHMTSYFKPKGEEKNLPYGEEVTLIAIGYQVTDQLGVAVVECSTPSKNEVKHITMWTAPGVSPAKSNQVLKELGWVPADPSPIQSVVGYFNGKEVVTSAPSE